MRLAPPSRRVCLSATGFVDPLRQRPSRRFVRLALAPRSEAKAGGHYAGRCYDAQALSGPVNLSVRSGRDFRGDEFADDRLDFVARRALRNQPPHEFRPGVHKGLRIESTASVSILSTGASRIASRQGHRPLRLVLFVAPAALMGC